MRIFFFLLLSVCLLPAYALVQSPAYQAPINNEKIRIEITVERNGRYTQTIERTTRALSEYGAIHYASHSYFSKPGSEEVDILDAFTISTDGKRTRLSPDWVKKNQRTQAANASEITDAEVSKVIFPNVSVGSRLYSKVRIHHHTPRYANQFSMHISLRPDQSYDQFEFIVHAPKSMPLNIKNRGFQGGMTSSHGKNTYRFSSQQEQAFAEEDGQVDDDDFSRTIVISTFENHLAVGKEYAREARLMAKVTPEIAALSKQLTTGMTTEEEKAHALYNWVSKNIRYISTDIGRGGLVPRPAKDVLRNRFGDCKDHVVLLEALLAAVGIPSSPVLVNSGESFVLSGAASIRPLNHVITYLPNLDLYLDSTSRFTPFGILPNSVIDKPVVLTAMGQFGRTPAMRAADHTARSKIRMTLFADGHVEGEVDSQMTGSPQIESRYARFNSASEMPEVTVRNLLFRFNEIGEGIINFTPPLALDSPYEVHSQFTLESIAALPGPGAFSIPVGLAPGRIPVMASFQQLKARQFDYVCDSHIDEDDYLLRLPPNMQVLYLPKDTEINESGVQYSARYQLDGDQITLKRRLEIQHESRNCTPADHEKWKSIIQRIRLDLRSQILFK